MLDEDFLPSSVNSESFYNNKHIILILHLKFSLLIRRSTASATTDYAIVSWLVLRDAGSLRYKLKM